MLVIQDIIIKFNAPLHQSCLKAQPLNRQCDGAANQAGSTKQNDSTTSPLADALVLKDKFIMLLQIMSQPFLQPLSTSMLSEFTTAYYYYAEAKHKSDQNYVSLNLSRV